MSRYNTRTYTQETSSLSTALQNIEEYHKMKANHIKQKQDTNSITDFQYTRYSLTPKVTPGQADTAA